MRWILRKKLPLTKPVLTIVLLALMSPAMANDTAATCPTIDSINRTPGVYSWNSTDPGWEGQFAAPTSGRGYSNKVKHFIEARWIQFSNLPESPGYVQCDYEGDIGNEVIRFSQTKNKATKRPDSEFWTKVANLRFPSIQRTCSYDMHLCSFEQL